MPYLSLYISILRLLHIRSDLSYIYADCLQYANKVETAMSKLTKSIVDKLPLPSTAYVMYWDEQDRGFGLRVTKNGKKTYIVQSRVNGKELRITIGPHGVFTVEQAQRGSINSVNADIKKAITPKKSPNKTQKIAESTRP